jgi:hypothetical protein
LPGGPVRITENDRDINPEATERAPKREEVLPVRRITADNDNSARSGIEQPHNRRIAGDSKIIQLGGGGAGKLGNE